MVMGGLEDYRPIDFGYGGGRRAADLDFGAAAACVRAAAMAEKKESVHRCCYLARRKGNIPRGRVSQKDMPRGRVSHQNEK